MGGVGSLPDIPQDFGGSHYRLDVTGQFIPYPHILRFLQGKKRGVNLYPITHNIENFSRWPTNLNDPLLKTPPRELCPSVRGSGLVELNTREFIGHTHNDIPRLRLPSRTYLVWSYMSCGPLAEHSEGKYNSLSVICITLRPL